jgi:hypothetical protein
MMSNSQSRTKIERGYEGSPIRRVTTIKKTILPRVVVLIIFPRSLMLE